VTTATQVSVGRQPIYDRQRRIQGYELLFRPHRDAVASGTVGEEATAAVIVNTFAEFGLEELVGHRKAFINIPTAFVDGSYELPFGPEGVVLELMQDISDTPSIRAGVHRLRERGYALALDHYTGLGAQSVFSELASYVKLDMMAIEPTDFRDLARYAASMPVTLVAERVETLEDADLARELGFELLQGWYFSKAETLSSDAIQVSGVTALRLLTQLSDPEVSLSDIEQIVRVDLALTYRVLRVVNSAAAGLSRRISSIREAISMLGLEQLRNWVMLFMLSDICGGSEGLLNQAITRARTCELMARDSGVATDEAFTAGLLSNLGELLGRPLDEVVRDLPLESDLRHAIVDESGPMGELLAEVRTYERLATGPLGPGSEPTYSASFNQIARFYLESMGWALRISRDLVEPVDQLDSLTAAAVHSQNAHVLRGV
jgi:EAL and modified HD-GYP domain-containing signal transduction protein